MLMPLHWHWHLAGNGTSDWLLIADSQARRPQIVAKVLWLLSVVCCLH